jgi:hypothetical protein
MRCGVGQKNKLTYRWARKGLRPRAAHDQRTQSTYLFGAVCPERRAGDVGHREQPPLGYEQPRRQTTDRQSAELGKWARLFDHLIGAGEQRRGHSEAECLGGLEVEHELELGRLHHGQLRRLGALEHSPGEDVGLAIGVREAHAVTQQAARLQKVGKRVDARDCVLTRTAAIGHPARTKRAIYAPYSPNLVREMPPPGNLPAPIPAYLPDSSNN